MLLHEKNSVHEGKKIPVHAWSEVYEAFNDAGIIYKGKSPGNTHHARKCAPSSGTEIPYQSVVLIQPPELRCVTKT